MRMAKKAKPNLGAQQREELLETLEERFEANMDRHEGLQWSGVKARLEAKLDKLASLNEMESSGGEPDVVGKDGKSGEIIFYDCAAESPKGRRSVCYDAAALASRQEHKPKDSALALASALGAEILTEDEYRRLQDLGPVDTKTSSWLRTPPEIRRLGGAIFGDHRYGTVFVYHNGAESYYAARGFRCSLRV
jgi:hypothetical protein